MLKRQAQQLSFLATICGGTFLALSAIPFTAKAQVNPCPSVYYEEPYNSTLASPQGCSANAASQMAPQAARPLTQPEMQQAQVPSRGNDVIARVQPTDGTVSVRLVNSTNADITYEAVGHTQPRTLIGGADIVLENLPAPVTLTMLRQDNGLIDITPVRNAETGVLEVSLRESPRFDDTLGTLEIQSDDRVVVN